MTAGQSAYAKRRDKPIFEALATKFNQPRDVIKYMIANFVYGHSDVIYDRALGQELLARWIKTKESLSKVFADDLQTIAAYCEKRKLPITEAFATDIVLKLLKSGQINIETASLLDQFMPKFLDKLLDTDVSKMIYEADALRIRKAGSFIKCTDNCIKVWNDFYAETNCTAISR